jgi:putative membrane protein
VRDHLANERTYLAWIRTAVALMGFGVVIVRLRYFLPAGAPTHRQGWELGLLFAGVGLAAVLLATLQYFRVRKSIEREEYNPGGHWVILLSLAVALIGAGVLYWLITTPVVRASPSAI